MALEDTLIASLGDELYEALVGGRTVPNLRDRAAGITKEDACRIQARMIERRLAGGETVVGKKIGVTSKGVQNMLGVFEPDFGILTSGMVYPDGTEIPAGTLIQPKAEGEIAFVLKRDLIGPGITAADVISATDYVSACFEIVDSRISDWDIKIQDTIADNASCGVPVRVAISNKNWMKCVPSPPWAPSWTPGRLPGASLCFWHPKRTPWLARYSF